MSLANPEDFQFSLEESFEGRLFTRRTDLSNDIRLLIGTNALHAMLNRVSGRYAGKHHESRVEWRRHL